MPTIEMDGCDVMNSKAEFSKGRGDTGKELAHWVVVWWPFGVEVRVRVGAGSLGITK